MDDQKCQVMRWRPVIIRRWGHNGTEAGFNTHKEWGVFDEGAWKPFEEFVNFCVKRFREAGLIKD